MEEPRIYVVEVVRKSGTCSDVLYVDGDGELAEEQRDAQRLTKAEAKETAEYQVGERVRIKKLKPGPKKAARLALAATGKAWIADGCYGTGQPRDDLVWALKRFIEVHSGEG